MRPAHESDVPAPTQDLADLAASVEARRRLARTEARSSARAHPTGVGLTRHADGCVVVAVVGDTGPTQVRALDGVRHRLAREAWAELVLDLSGLTGDCGPALVRVLGRLRVQRLTAGARVEVDGAPDALVAELGARPATTFTVS